MDNFLTDRTQKVLVDAATFDTAPVEYVLPQGSVFSPVLFLVYINDLPDYISNGSSAQLFADDSVLLSQPKTQNSFNKI